VTSQNRTLAGTQSLVSGVTARSLDGLKVEHLGATRSIKVIDAGQRTLGVTQGRCRTVRLLHFAAALSSPVVASYTPATLRDRAA
jgi:hypothetical protein